MTQTSTASPRHFLDIAAVSPDDLRLIIEDAARRKSLLPAGDKPLAGKMLAMIFDKPSTRTRVSFDVAMRQLGGETLFLSGAEMQLGRSETIADTARVLSRYVDAIMIRTDDHAKIEELAEHASVPVINGLTDLSHPCQIVADLLTIVEGGKALPGLELAWLGDGNNVLASLIEAAGLFGFNVRAGVPQGYDPDMRFVEAARAQGARIDILRDAAEAVAGADIVVTDTWVSMGQDHAHNKLAAMAPYQVDERLMGKAKGDALFLHCLPAHRGEEVVDAVIDGAQSRVWDEAENRVHAQKSVLLWALGKL